MKFFLHTFFTWVLSILLLPVDYLLADFFFFSSNDFLINPGVLLFLVFLSFVFSSPAFLICWALLTMLIPSRFSPQEKLFLWVLGVLVTVISCTIVLLYLISGELLSMDILIVCWPAYLSTFLIILLRYQYFFNLLPKTNNNGNV